MSSNPTGFKIYCGTEYPATNDYYDLDDLFIRRDRFTRGGLWIWGSGLGGQLGNDLTTSRSSPVQTCISGSRWRKVCLSKHDGYFGLALSSLGQVWGWGCNNSYQMSDGTTADYLCPRRINAADNINLISAGGAAATAYSPGTDVENSAYGDLSNTLGEKRRIIWGCIEGGRGGTGANTTNVVTSFSNADFDKSWVDISMGNRYGVGIVDYCVQVNVDSTTVPGNLVEWGAGKPSAYCFDFPATVYSRNYTGGTNGFSRVFLSGGLGAQPLSFPGDYTIEYFVCQTSTSGTFPQRVLDTRCPGGSGSYGPVFMIQSGKEIYFEVRRNDSTYASAVSPSLCGDRWYHVAASRISNTTQLYLNGVRFGCILDNFSHPNTCITIAADGFDASTLNECFQGSLSNLRITRGAGLYSGTCFDIPVPPLQLMSNSTANTTLLMMASNYTDTSPSNLCITDVVATTTQEIFKIEQLTPRVLSTESWKLVSAGNTHALALKCDGTLWTWGCNHKGQLGTGDTLNRSRPVQVGTSNNWTAITAGCNFSAAILAGSFKCNAAVLYTWGENTDGQLGIDTTTDRSSPTQITSSCTNWKKISGGDSHFAALQTDGTVWTWGSNQFGELGRGDRVNRSSPVQVFGNTTGWYDISAGQRATAGLREDAW